MEESEKCLFPPLEGSLPDSYYSSSAQEEDIGCGHLIHVFPVTCYGPYTHLSWIPVRNGNEGGENKREMLVCRVTESESSLSASATCKVKKEIEIRKAMMKNN